MAGKSETTGAQFKIDPPMTFAVAVNKCVGKFNLSKEIKMIMGLDADRLAEVIQIREAPELVGAIRMLGTKASSGYGSEIVLEDLPSDTLYEIESDCGVETVKVLLRHPLIKYLRFR